MAENTKIEWTDHTFSPWIGCDKVHTGCANCYAEADMDKRKHRVKWGKNGTRSRTSDDYWRQPKRWNEAAEKVGERRRVFCASLADVFEDWQGSILDANGNPLRRNRITGVTASWPGPSDEHSLILMSDLHRDLFTLIDKTPCLDWLLLTKRPENIRRMWPILKSEAPIFPGMPGPLGQPQPCIIEQARRSNCWLGTSISDQKTADEMVPELLKCRDLAPVLFLSCEPLVGPVDLSAWLHVGRCKSIGPKPESFRCGLPDGHGPHPHSALIPTGSPWFGKPQVDWVIVGGESGRTVRPCQIDWIRSIVHQCQSASVPCFVKQLGAEPIAREQGPMVSGGCWDSYAAADRQQLTMIRDRKGGAIEEWPVDLRVRQWPEVAQ